MQQRRLSAGGRVACHGACGLFLLVSASFGQTSPPPYITATAPPRVAVGETVTLTGTAFGDYLPETSSVRVGRCPSRPDSPGPGLLAIAPGDITSWSGAEIKFVLPPRSLGMVSIIRSDGQMSNVAEFEVVSPCAPPAVAAVVNAASLLGGPVAPGEIVALFGSGLGPATPAELKLDSGGRVASQLAETRVWFDQTAAPLTYVSEGQVNAIVPFGLSVGLTTRVIVEYSGLRSEPVELKIAQAAPGVFTLDGSGRGRGAVLNQDGTLNSPSSPAAPDSVVAFFAAGAGPMDPPAIDGALSTGELPRPSQTASVRIGDRPAEVLYAGAAPGLVAGVLQVNARVPRDLMGGGPLPLVLFIGAAATQSGVVLEVSPR